MVNTPGYPHALTEHFWDTGPKDTQVFRAVATLGLGECKLAVSSVCKGDHYHESAVRIGSRSMGEWIKAKRKDGWDIVSLHQGYDD